MILRINLNKIVKSRIPYELVEHLGWSNELVDHLLNLDHTLFYDIKSPYYSIMSIQYHCHYN